MREEDRGGATAVPEMQGMDGAFSFAELLLQRIWARGDFDRAKAVTLTGEAVRIHRAGRWNRLGGPDFQGARIEMGGRILVGDIEVHLRAADWRAHGHRDDPRYRDVILHVVLFPGHNAPAIRADGLEIPVLVMLPLLYRSLEEYAEDDAVERLANHPLHRAQEILAALGREELEKQLQACAASRWEQKVRFARARVEKLGWEDACHHTALEVLGYRFNRGPMLAIAGEHPLRWWREHAQPWSVTALHERNRERWNRQAVRPANHPKTRLFQYAAWVSARPDWPARLGNLILPPVCPDGTVAETRRRAGLGELQGTLAVDVAGSAIGGTRRETLVCDGFLPLLAAGRPDAVDVLARLWAVWYPGDVPANLLKLLRNLPLKDAAGWRISHGVVQGLLAWVWREEERTDQTAACW